MRIGRIHGSRALPAPAAITLPGEPADAAASPSAFDLSRLLASRRVGNGIELVLGAAWLAFVLHTILPDERTAPWFDHGVYYVLLVAASGGCLARAVLRRHNRWAWALIGTGLTLWTCGDLYYLFALQGLDRIPVPSLSDAFYLTYLPFMYAGLLLLMRRRVAGATRTLWIDGLTAALTVAAIASAVLIGPIRAANDGAASAVATNLAYPLGDVVLLALVAALAAARGFQLDRATRLLVAGLVAATVADATYLVQATRGTYVEGGLVDAIWPASLLLIGAAAWRDRPTPRALPTWRPVTAMPLAFGTVATCLLIASLWLSLGGLGPLLASAAVLTVLGRLAVTLRENRRLLATASDAAGTDSLTGLPNRRALIEDLEALVPAATTAAPLVVALFDLDGFKRYNDTFGHPAGDALLHRLGARLRRLERENARVFRLGGDEFCLVAQASPATAAGLIDRAVADLSEDSEGFRITASFGAAFVPAEAETASDVLRLADVRLYSRKAEFYAEGDTPHEELLRVLDARDPAGAATRSAAAALARRLAGEAGLDERAQRDIERATLLSDVGMLAVPDDLADPDHELTDDEARLLERHPHVGERIVSTVPALRPLAPLVRSAHERWDGNGFPDRLAGTAIPFGARISAIATAFAASLAVGDDDLDAALARVARRAGEEFDPDLVILLARCSLEMTGR